MATIEEAVAKEREAYKATARKSGRNPAWPYVPVLVREGRQSQIVKRAFATRGEAVTFAERHIDRLCLKLAEDLAKPNYRALRAHHGVEI